LTACFKLMRALQPKEEHPAGTSLCNPCVYFSKNLDPMKLQSDEPVRHDGCGLGFLSGDEGCNEMRTNNCSAGKKQYFISRKDAKNAK